MIDSMASDNAALLVIFWLSLLSLGHPLFGILVKLAVALDISKAVDRVWHKALISKLPSFGFYPSLCNFVSSFLSNRSIAAGVDGHCSSPKSINSSVLQGSALSPTLPFYYSSMIF